MIKIKLNHEDVHWLDENREPVICKTGFEKLFFLPEETERFTLVVTKRRPTAPAVNVKYPIAEKDVPPAYRHAPDIFAYVDGKVTTIEPYLFTEYPDYAKNCWIRPIEVE